MHGDLTRDIWLALPVWILSSLIVNWSMRPSIFGVGRSVKRFGSADDFAYTFTSSNPKEELISSA